MKCYWILLFMLYGLQLQAQTDWQTTLRQWMNAEDMEEEYGEEVMDWLEERAENRINLNQTAREELEQLPFLTAQQVEELVEYLDRYYPMRTLNELKMIKTLDWDTRRLLECFVYVGEEKPRSVWPKLKDVAKYGRHQLMATAKIPFYDREGDRNGYLGYKYRHDVRYQFNYNNRIKFGLTGAQDAGEPFFSNRNNLGYDHYALYFQLRDMGRIEELNVGTYRVQMGLGLVMNTGFYLGKLAVLQSLGRSTHLLTAHTSRSQDGYLQGAAATVRIGNDWHITAFASQRSVDATLNDDGSARTLLKDGYHRTPAEMAKKHNTHKTDLGGSIGYRKGTLHVSLNAAYTHLNRSLQPQKATALYRRYAAEGSDFINVSADYGYNNDRWTFSGETAVNREGALAAIHTVSWRTSESLSLMVLHRYYDKRYTALHARSFSEGSSVQNEHGIYVGATWRPSAWWLLQGYVDYAHFAWARYQVSLPSDAFDLTASTRYSRGRWTAEGRYRLHLRQRDNSDKTLLENRIEQRTRLRLAVEVLPQLSLQTQADGIYARLKGTHSAGLMVSQHATWQWRWLTVDAHGGWFRTDDYDSRIYQHERSVTYDFGMPAYYGHGLRYALMLRAGLSPHFMVTTKAGVTNYFNRSTIGSGLQQVRHSSMTELLVQLIVKI